MRWTMMIWVDIHIFSSSVRLHLHSSNQYIEVVEKRKISLAWTGSHLMSEPAKSLVLDCLFRGSIRLMRRAEEGGCPLKKLWGRSKGDMKENHMACHLALPSRLGPGELLLEINFAAERTQHV